MNNTGLRKALILDGETRSKVYSPKDRRSAFLFGDGGVAALVERNEKFGTSYFSLNSDGSRGDLIKINGGGYRMPSSAETIKEKVCHSFRRTRLYERWGRVQLCNPRDSKGYEESYSLLGSGYPNL